MKMSDDKRRQLYNAIYEPIMEQRIEFQRGGSPNSGTLDSKLFSLQNEIWKRVHRVLKIEGPA